jgi:DNA-directed RNA polymerase specialized sigma24 family protein
MKMMKRVPVTQEYMAMCVQQMRRGETVEHPAAGSFAEELGSSIAKMIHGMANKYQLNSRDEETDLFQDCMQRLWKGIDTYDAGRAKFTTWAWMMCKTVLNARYNKDVTFKQRVSYVEKDVLEQAPDKSMSEPFLNEDYMSAVRMLASRHEKWKPFIFSLLGDMEGNLPERISVAQAARQSGVTYTSAVSFYHGVVQPFMLEWFA